MTKKLVKFLVFSAITLLILYLITRKIDYSSLGETLSSAKWYWLVAATLLMLLTPLISAKRWQLMLRAMGYSLGFGDCLKIILAAFPVSAITPAKAGDLIRAYYLKNRIPANQVVGGVVAERLSDIFVLALYSCAGAILFGNYSFLLIGLAVIFLIPVFFLIVNKINLPLGQWRKKVDDFLLVSRVFIQHPSKILPVLLWGITLWFIPVLAAKMLFLALGVSVPLVYTAAVFPLAIFVGLIPITIAGMGTRDSAIVYLFASFANSSVSLGAGLLYSLLAYWLLALLGLPVMRKLKPLK